MTGYRFALTCPRCASPVEHITTGHPIAGTQTSAICRCTICPRTWQIVVHLRPVATDPGASERQRLSRQRRALIAT